MHRESPQRLEKRLLQELSAGIAGLARAEDDAGLAYRGELAAARERAEQARRAADAAFHTEQRGVNQELSSAREAIESRAGAERQSIEGACDRDVERISREVALAEQKATQAQKEARWLAHSVYEAHNKRLVEQATRMQQRLERQQHAVRGIAQQARDWIVNLGLALPAESEATSAAPDENEAKLSEQVNESIEHCEADLKLLRGLRLPRLAQGGGFAAIFALVAVVTVPLGYLVFGNEPIRWIVVCGVLTVIMAVGLCVWLRTLAQRQLAVAFAALGQSLTKAGALCQQALQQTAVEAKRKKRKLRDQRDGEYAKADESRAVVAAACDHRRQVELPELTRSADQRLLALEDSTTAALRVAEHQHQSRAAAAQERNVTALAAVEATLAQQVAAIEARREQAQAENLTQWNLTLTTLQTQLVELHGELKGISPDWPLFVSGLPAPRHFPRAIRFGHLAGRRHQGLAADQAASIAGLVEDAPVEMPAALSFPDGVSMLVKSDVAGRGAAIELLQTVMLRLLTSLPPGKVRLTIIDPTGLGENFASFMHLADHDELLVNHRIWTEPAQIERKLAEITEHMETVIQKYLRNEFATIHDYNEQAGEIAEPLRVIVVAGFPTAFTESAVRRLTSIAANGPRCGVHVLISTERRLPKNLPVNLADFERHAQVFHCEGEQVTWQDPDFQTLKLTVEPAPSELGKPILHAVGQAAVATRRVEVPFEAIAPAPADVWQSDSRRGIEVPLGRAGASRLQSLRLGEGTSQHVLIAGKTGSGKSTLLHALITNAALRYAPSDLQLYLIDFKKGVEFKSYVTRRLPHARVVAIESEREFGLSVMQRLDSEMRRRGEQFREAGVQDIGAFRDLGRELPRVLFIVDEFQEFFVQDDKVAQDAALLLDRLVRQGRAFGIHVILGSQTLSGAYGLARSTLGQMAVRIALQCNESDAQVILSEDNTAARLLTRPGEAIYNDANGLVEGNHLFQIVWASDERREHYLEQLADRAIAANVGVAAPIVFEGSQPADMEQNSAIVRTLANGTHADAAPRLWLGEPLAIDEATNVTLARRSAANLLWIGQNDRAAGAMMTASLVSFLALGGPSEEADAAQCVLLHGGAIDPEFAATLKILEQAFPTRIAVHNVGDTAQMIDAFAGELDRRRTLSAPAAPRLLLLHDLARLRPLRRKDDEFSYSRMGQDAVARPDQQFLELLREGPALGLHTLAWCDTLANFNRTLERSALKEFDTRVLLQMNAADSSLLTDTAAASQLGPHRALLHREDHGVLEKFRPFSQPSSTWLAATCQALLARHATEKSATALV